MTPEDLTERSTHFEFGANWADFARRLDPGRIAAAEQALGRLLGDTVRGANFLDIGCGSGLHALAALRLGAARVVAVDLDENSVATTRAVLTAHAPGAAWEVLRQSVFELDPDALGRFEVVYSWGVLHHTGAMHRAIQQASRMVSPRGTFALALYNRTRLCDLWAREKRYYARASKPVQRLIRGAFMAAFLAYLPATDFRPWRFVRDYGVRGMRWSNDVHDWLGGYPYESATPGEIERFLRSLGFRQERAFTVGPQLGLWGSGCNEFVFAREGDDP